MRFFASALHEAFATDASRPSEGESSEGHWRGVRAYKLTATSWAQDRHRGFLATLPRDCRLSVSKGPHPVEYLGGACFGTIADLERLRRPSPTSVQLFARKMAPGVLRNLLALDYV